MNTLLQTAIKAALKAGKTIIEIYNSDDFGLETKTDNSPLTKADKAAHEIISSCLKDFKIPILSEEGKEIPYQERKNWEKLWIVDPIDGTKEFIKRNGEFTVNIALIENNLPIMGVIYVPALTTLYYSDDKTAYKLENVTADNFESEVTNVIKLPCQKVENKTIKVVASKSHLSPETQEFIDHLKTKHEEVNTISKGSSLKLCMVAEGTADFYPRYAPTMEWDTAAGQAICIASGCDVIDYKTNKTMTYNRKNLLNNWFLVKR
jgi:3'(2'), 5'-bisphosphate nucleotidase